MTLVERLRGLKCYCAEAADRIEALEKALREIDAAYLADQDDVTVLKNVVAIARAALKEGEDDTG